MDPSKRGFLGIIVTVVAVFSAAGPTVCHPDEPIGGGPFVQADADVAGGADSSDDEPQRGHSVFVPAERRTLLLLDRARLFLDQGRYAEAVQCLGAILESPEDYFLDDAGPVHPSLKSEAQRLLGQMSRRGREWYELEYGAVARRMLEEAVAAGDAGGLAEVSRRFFHTQAGYEATLLLGIHHLDHMRPLAGALTLKRLRDASPIGDQFEPSLSLAMATCWLRAGMPDKARLALSDLKKRYPTGSVAVAGEEVALFADQNEALDWLAGLIGSRVLIDSQQTDGWAMPHGNASRNASTGGGGPLLSTRWRVPTTDHPFVESLIEKLRQDQREEDAWLLPGLHPLVVDDVVLMRTVTNLLAVDFVTGKRIWEVPVDDPFEAALDPPPDVPFRQQPQLEMNLRFRLWGDATFGTISSDGRCVFTIEDLNLGIGTSYPRQIVFQGQRRVSTQGPKPYNRLSAYEVRTGKLKWQLGGPPDEGGLPQAGVFFLGPPLPLMGHLYVLAESKGEIRLLALDAAGGDLLWDQQLAIVDRDILNDPLRRLAGVSPSYADGILVCPTSNKSVVALELTTRSLLWGYTYSSQRSGSPQRAMFFGVRSAQDPDPDGRWVDSSAVLAKGRALVTPMESNYLHCLNLVDGKLLWKQPRQDDFYLACVYDNKVVLVGRRQLRALELDDGEPAWESRTVKYPAGSVPSGWGFLSGNRYYVPLSTSQVMAVDLEAGRSAHVFKSRRENVPGNMVCYKDKIISQRADGLEALYQLETLREQVQERLAAKPDDAEALALSGEIRWDDGKLEEAIQFFRRSLELASTAETRELLRDAFFEGLRDEFAKYGRRVEEIQELIGSPSEQAAVWRLMALGFEKAGEYGAALEHYRKLIKLDQEDRGMEVVDGSLSVRRDRWIQVRLAALGEKVPSDVKADLDQFAETQLKTALGEATPEALERFLDYFGGQPIGDRARGELVRRLKQAGRLLPWELLLQRQQRSEDPQRAAAAVAELAEVFHRQKRWQDAAVCYVRLEREFSDVPCADGKTGRELVEALTDDDPVRGWLRSDTTWPEGKVLVEKSDPAKMPPATYGRSVIEYQGGRAPFFSDLTVELRQTPVQLVVRDGFGRQRSTLPMEALVRREHFSFSRSLMRVEACGHLLLLSMGNKLVAVDTLGARDNASPRILWSQDLNGPDIDSIRRQQMRMQLANVPGGLGRLQLSRVLQVPLGGVVAVSEQVLCFKRFRNLIAVDPVTGKTLWIRRNIRPDSTVFGDHQYVFVVPPGKTTAMVLRAQDGELLAERKVPPEAERLTTVGRRILVWRDAGEQNVMELVDPWQQNDGNRTVWSPGKFDPDAKLYLVDNEAVAVFEPGGKFVLLNLADGRAIIDEKLQPERSLIEIFVLRSLGQYLLITSSEKPQENSNRRTYAMHGVASARIDRGRIYAFDLEGNKLWPSPVTVKGQFLPLNQPSRLPVVTLACMVQEREPNARTRSKTSILCIHRPSGKEVYEEEFPNPTNSFHLIGDPEKHTVQIQLQRKTVTMTFSEVGPTVSTAILRALRKAVIGGPRQPASPQDRNPSSRSAPKEPKTDPPGDSPPKGGARKGKVEPESKVRPVPRDDRGRTDGDADVKRHPVPGGGQRIPALRVEVETQPSHKKDD